MEAKVLNVIEEDRKECIYELYSGRNASFDITISNNELTFHGEEFGADCESIFGRSDGDFYYKMSKEDTYKFLTQLRLEQGIELSLEEILRIKFGSDEGSLCFLDYCKKRGIVLDTFVI